MGGARRGGRGEEEVQGEKARGEGERDDGVRGKRREKGHTVPSP